MKRILRSLLVCAAIVAPSRLLAQDAAADTPSDEPAPELSAAQEAALEPHLRGADALAEARFAEARDYSRDALRIWPNAGSAYNLALALRGTGESTEAIALFEQLLAGEYGALGGDDRRNDIQNWLRDERGALATVEVNVEGPEHANVRVDGRGVGSVDSGGTLTLTLDAGRRTLMAEATGFVTAEEVLFADRASRSSLTLILSEAEQERRIFEKPGFWVVVGLVVAAAVVAGVVVALGPYESAPQSTEPFGVATALSVGR